MVDPNRLAESVRFRLDKSSHAVTAYWVRVSGDRESYLAEFSGHIGDDPIVPLIVRGPMFDNPNSVLADLVELISQNRSAFGFLASARERPPTKCAIVLLARSELSVPQASSPVNLPEWFPVSGGQTVYTVIEDLTWTADGPLNAPETSEERLCEALFSLEAAILRRLTRVHTSDHNAGNALLQLIRRQITPPEGLIDIVTGAEQFRTEVRNPSAFRPSVREGRSITARLWKVVAVSSFDQLGGPSRALASALGLFGGPLLGFHEAIVSVMSRPSNRDPTEQVRFARNLLMTTASVCQLVTAAAHADSYGSYPVALLRMLSFDLRSSMNSSENLLNILP